MSKETEQTICIDMKRISNDLRLSDDWSTCSPDDICDCVNLVLAEVDEHTDVVQIFGSMPNIVAMSITAALYPVVGRLEYGAYKGPRYVVFELDEGCHESN